ncbi:hypothetical protein Clacol_003702 [Clathrus columnatus]|uniref:Uncharacterized protein n=1 Tax=Clathrus columnatus TaxID=1419009 RepID=A0AAV5A4B9_9AGAM|nr:hypothetical protein Clacol_003702 [Clathrus columnatus]
MDSDDPIVAILPVLFTTTLAPNLHLHQFPLLYRSLQVPPSASESGKRIRSRYKPRSGRLEVQVPVDVRKEVWNPDKGLEFGRARAEEDAERSFSERKKVRQTDTEHRLNDVRLRSERIAERGDYMLGIVRDGRLHLHPISQTHQLRPSLTYLDVLSQQLKRSKTLGSESDSDEAPPPDPDEPVASTSATKLKKEKQVSESKEIQVIAKKSTEDKTGSLHFQGGMSQIRREMLIIIRDEAEEQWVDLQYCDMENKDSLSIIEALSGQNDSTLLKLRICQTTINTGDPRLNTWQDSQLHESIQFLEKLENVQHIGPDFDKGIAEAAGIITGFLYREMNMNSHGITPDQSIMVLSEFLRPTLLKSLFTYRETGLQVQLSDMPEFTVNWVELVLFKLSEAVLQFSGPYLVISHSQDSERTLWNDTLDFKRSPLKYIRASHQLPSTWSDIHYCLSSTSQISQAAKRLALCLLFGVYVLSSYSTSSIVEEFSDVETLQKSLYEYMKRAGAAISYENQRQLYKSQYSLLLILFSTLDQTLAIHAGKYCYLSLHPSVIDGVMALVGHIMLDQRGAFLVESLTAEKVRLIQRDNIISWCWKIWATAPCWHERILQLMAIWLYHFGVSSMQLILLKASWAFCILLKKNESLVTDLMTQNAFQVFLRLLTNLEHDILNEPVREIALRFVLDSTASNHILFTDDVLHAARDVTRRNHGSRMGDVTLDGSIGPEFDIKRPIPVEQVLLQQLNEIMIEKNRVSKHVYAQRLDILYIQGKAELMSIME